MNPNPSYDELYMELQELNFAANELFNGFVLGLLRVESRESEDIGGWLRKDKQFMAALRAFHLYVIEAIRKAIEKNKTGANDLDIYSDLINE